MTHPPLLIILLAALLALLPASANAQPSFGPPSPSASTSVSPTAATTIPSSQPDIAEALSNPIKILEDAASVTPGLKGGLSGAVNILLLMTVLTLVPAIMVMTTCFVRFTIVLGLLKQALGAQSLPPSQVILALSLFMTFLVMAPTFERIHKEALLPYQQGAITDQIEMWERTKQPLRDYMFAQIDASENWSSLYMVMNYRGVDTSQPERLTRQDVDTITLLPAYMLSELKIAFLMGFRVYLPFLVIDMVISSLLISMSMMMLPPVLISLPFKLLLFVLVDGWELVVGSLMASVAQPESAAAAASAAAAFAGAG